MTFKLQNKFIAGFVSWVGLLGDLTAKQARMRGRFLLLLVARLNEVNANHKELLTKFSTKDAEDKPVTKLDENGLESYQLSTENLEAFRKEDQELLDEEYILDITEANQEMFDSVKGLVLNTAYTFGPKETDTDQEKQQKINQANDYDTWCKAFEDVK